MVVVGVVVLIFGRRTSFRGENDDDAPLEYTAPIRFEPPLRLVTLDALKTRDPALTFQSIEARVHRMSEIVRDSWCAGDMRAARPCVSDGVFGRFQVQLALMRSEGRRNVMRDAQLLDVELEDVESVPPLDIVYVRVQAKARDTEVAWDATEEQIAHALEHVDVERYEEIWSLVRRQGATTTRDASTFGRACASCGAPILDAQGGTLATAGEMIRCRYCGALLCSGEHDWVLSEITQISAWHPAWPAALGLEAFRARDPEAVRTVLEDRASYLFWKFVEAGRTRSAAPLRKCATDAFLVSRGSVDEIAALRDVAVGGVDLVSIERGAYDVSRVRVFWSAKAQPNAQVAVPMQSVLRLVRKSGVSTRASMTALVCSRCGAGIGDSDTSTCDHCGALLAAGDDAWVLDGIEHEATDRT